MSTTKGCAANEEGPSTRNVGALVAAALVTASLLAVVQVVVDRPMLLAERFVPGLGWVALALFSVYAAWVCDKLLDPAEQPRWRRRIWGLFSIVFFGQLALGLLGVHEMLMSAQLHPPVPAVILGGPIYRGERFFMPTLLGATLLLVGPAWCSHLCYFGAMDSASAFRRRRPRALPRWSRWVRVGLLVGVVAAAAGLRIAGVGPRAAAVVSLAFGALGVLLMVVLSRRAGTMVHCTVYCPIGLVVDVAGKVSPFRIRISDSCDQCGACTKACRFDALGPSFVERKSPDLTCSLCGDCVSACHGGAIDYRFLGLRPSQARTLFVVLVASLHAVFLAVARI